MYMLTDYQELQDCCSWIYQEARFHYKVTFDDGDEGLVKDSIASIIRLFAVRYHSIVSCLGRASRTTVYHDYGDSLFEVFAG